MGRIVERPSYAGWPFWSGAIAALGLSAALGCIPAGAPRVRRASLVVAGGAPVLAIRKAFA